MKRKRGHKKGKKQKAVDETVPSEVVANVVSEDDSGDDEEDSGMEVGTPSSTGTDQPLVSLLNMKSDASFGNAPGNSVGRVKVKLKTSSRPLDSDGLLQSDAEKGSPPVGLERQETVSKKVENTVNPAGERKIAFSGIVYKKSGKIKIKSSKMLGDSNVDKADTAVPATVVTSSQKEEKVVPTPKEPEAPRQDSRYNKEELDSALGVIRKVMKMEAAAPFNEPVNPEALGIPDYFDIIDTPMDFGTICSNIEKGDKYKNSEDVFKDVQYIWDNCSKYNNKGDAIMDLMRRVKKNFMKYWSAASLYTDQSRGRNGAESIEVEDGSGGKTQTKASQSKIKSKKQGKRHKSDCLCAICILKRRKREREASARLSKGQSGVQELKEEESSPLDSPGGEDSSQNNDEVVDLEEDAEMEDRTENEKFKGGELQYSPMEEKREEEEDEENEVKILNKGEGETKQQLEVGSRLAEEPGRQSQAEIKDKSSAGSENQKVSTPAQHEAQNDAVNENKNKELQENQEKAKKLHSFYIENPLLLNLCGALFPENKNSIWRGPHSLFQRQRSSQTSPLQAAIDTIMK